MTDSSIDFQELVTTIGDRLRWLREKHNMPKQELAERLNVSCQEIEKYETGTINVVQLYRYADIFNESIDWFFPEDDTASIITQKEINHAADYCQLEIHLIRADYWAVYGKKRNGMCDCLGEYSTEADAHDFTEKVQEAYPHLRKFSVKR